MSLIIRNLQFPRISKSKFYKFKLRRLYETACIKSNLYYSSWCSYKNLSNLSKMESISKENIFAGVSDRFNGITVNSEKEFCKDIQEFTKKLEESLHFWRKNGNRGIWFKIYLNNSEWIPVLTKRGFKFHHARDEYVMMYLWLPVNEICNIPPFAHTMIGVGAVVVNDKCQVLVVSEKYSIIKSAQWKLPGGYVEPGENLVDAVIREVFEETNILTEFQSLLAFRHAHGGMFGCSDMYIVVSLKPLSGDIKKCDREIAQSKWMDITEYLEHPHVHELNRFFVQKYLEYDKANVKINCYHGIHQILKKPYTLYSVTTTDIEVTEETKLASQQQQQKS